MRRPDVDATPHSAGAAVVGRTRRHPLALFPILYKEVQLLAAAVGDWRLTAVVSAAEERLFRGQPSLYLSERLSVVAVSEYPRFRYLAYPGAHSRRSCVLVP